MKLLLVLAALTGGLSCATLKKDTTVCPEYRSLRCAGDTYCDMDKSRGCKVCRCQSIDGTNADPPPDLPRPEGD